MGKKPGKVLESSLWSPWSWGLAQGQALCAQWKVLPMCSDVKAIKQSSRKGRKSEIPGKEKFSSQSLSGEKAAEPLAKIKLSWAQPAGCFLPPLPQLGNKLLSVCDLEQAANCFEKVLLSFFLPTLRLSLEA